MRGGEGSDGVFWCQSHWRKVLLLCAALTISLGLVAHPAGVRALHCSVPDVQMKLKVLLTFTRVHPPPAQLHTVSRALKGLNDLFACLLPEFSRWSSASAICYITQHEESD